MTQKQTKTKILKNILSKEKFTAQEKAFNVGNYTYGEFKKSKCVKCTLAKESHILTVSGKYICVPWIYTQSGKLK